jgi:hypothetical protein
MKTYPKGSVKIYDNGGKSFDRYTAVFMDQPERGNGMFAAVGMSEHPFHPQGFGQHTVAMVGRHLGKLIDRAALPQDCRILLQQDGY